MLRLRSRIFKAGSHAARSSATQIVDFMYTFHTTVLTFTSGARLVLTPPARRFSPLPKHPGNEKAKEPRAKEPWLKRRRRDLLYRRREPANWSREELTPEVRTPTAVNSRAHLARDTTLRERNTSLSSLGRNFLWITHNDQNKQKPQKTQPIHECFRVTIEEQGKKAPQTKCSKRLRFHRFLFDPDPG